MIKLSRLLILIFLLIPLVSYASPKEIDWDDLIPWNYFFSPGEVKFNKSLVDKEVKIPGYVLPLDMYGRGVNTFLLVPYIGACIHVPPPPPNQLVYVTTEEPWDAMTLWEPVWVTGKIIVKAQTNIWAETGYQISADEIDFYDY